MRKLFTALLFVLSCYGLKAQSTHDVMVGGGLDVIKTDNEKVLDKVQLGFELNYFVTRRFAVGGGAEIWTHKNGNTSSFVMGMRLYMNDQFFARFRGLIGANDASLGVGWSKPINSNWRFEALGDFYFQGD